MWSCPNRASGDDQNLAREVSSSCTENLAEACLNMRPQAVFLSFDLRRGVTASRPTSSLPLAASVAQNGQRHRLPRWSRSLDSRANRKTRNRWPSIEMINCRRRQAFDGSWAISGAQPATSPPPAVTTVTYTSSSAPAQRPIPARVKSSVLRYRDRYKIAVANQGQPLDRARR